MASIKYNKLVRDKIPAIIQKDGKEAKTRRLDGAEYIAALKLKLEEELDEYKETGDIEELADMMEVIYGILDYHNISFQEFEEIRRDKAEKRGAFKDRILLIEVKEE